MITKINLNHEVIKGDDNLLLPQQILVKDFDADTSSFFSSNFNRVHNLPQQIIPIQVDSFGGSVYSLLGILDVIAASKKPVATYVNSKAMSCGAVLLSAGNHGLRFASKNSTILIHEVESSSYGKNANIQADAGETARLNDILLEILAKNSKKRQSFYYDLISSENNADVFITATEAKKYGLIDKIKIPTMEMDVSVSYKIY